MHWGLFKLAHHGWTEPVERVLAAARCTDLTVLTPRPGAERGADVTPARRGRAALVAADAVGDGARRSPSSPRLDGVATHRVTLPTCPARQSQATSLSSR